MKKGLIGIIIAGVFAIGYLTVTQYKDWTSSDNKAKQVETSVDSAKVLSNKTEINSTNKELVNKADTTKQANQTEQKKAEQEKADATQSNTSKNNTAIKSNNIVDNNDTASNNNKVETKNVSTQNIKQKPNVNILENQTQLSALANSYLQDFNNLSNKTNSILNNQNQDQQQLDQSAANAYVLWNNELNKLFDSIKQNLTQSELTQLNLQENLWINFKDQSVSSLTGQGSIVPLLQADRALYLTQERCYYLFLYYLNNNSDFPVSSLNSSLTNNNGTGAFVSEFQSDLAQTSSEFAINSNDTSTQILSNYNQLYNKFNSDLNSLYGAITAKVQNSDYELQDVQSADSQWVTYKENAVDLAGQQYNDGTDNKIAEQKTNLALTQARYFNLLNTNGYFLNQ